MAQIFLSLPFGIPGATVAVPVSEDLKTFYAGGDFRAEKVVLEVSADGTNFIVGGSVSLDKREPLPVVFSAAYARMNVVGLRSGEPTCFLGVDEIAGTRQSVSIVAPGSPGVGASAALNTLPRVKSFFVLTQGNSFDVEAVFEVSLDGVNFNPLFKISGLLFRNGDVVNVEGFFSSGRIRVLSGTGNGMIVSAVADPTCC